MTSLFDDIRPYRDDEIPAAMQRIAASEYFPLLASYVFPATPVDEVREFVLSFRTIYDFQAGVMARVNEQVIERTTTSFTYGGIELLDPAKNYLFVSNHRDIMLDSSLLQYVLHKNGLRTTEITFGANLMSTPLVIDIGKSNKMFRTERGGNMKEFYKQSLYLSQYIRYVITEKGESVWIAQRNGRTKDGNDATDQGIIKMFAMSRSGSRAESLAELNIVPVAVSYEWESCDILKTLELYQSRSAKYVKKSGEDLNSILTGIMQPKGRVHIEVCRPITLGELQPFDDLAAAEFNRKAAALLDERIYEKYLLTPNNYIAWDLRSGGQRFADRYTAAEKEAFMAHLSKLDAYAEFDRGALREIMLGIYANPIEHKIFQ